MIRKRRTQSVVVFPGGGGHTGLSSARGVWSMGAGPCLTGSQQPRSVDWPAPSSATPPGGQRSSASWQRPPSATGDSENPGTTFKAAGPFQGRGLRTNTGDALSCRERREELAVLPQPEAAPAGGWGQLPKKPSGSADKPGTVPPEPESGERRVWTAPSPCGPPSELRRPSFLYPLRHFLPGSPGVFLLAGGRFSCGFSEQPTGRASLDRARVCVCALACA